MPDKHSGCVTSEYCAGIMSEKYFSTLSEGKEEYTYIPKITNKQT
jgi:hypothetical protein